MLSTATSSLEALNSNERPCEPLLTELLRVTKKVKNKEDGPVDGVDQEMHELESSKISFKDMLMGNKGASTEDDVCLPLNAEKEIGLLEDDVRINRDGPYPQVYVSERVHALIDENNKQTVVVRMLESPIGFKALSNRIESFWGISNDYKIVDLDNNYFLVKFASQMITIELSWEALGWYMATTRLCNHGVGISPLRKITHRKS